MEDRRRHKNIVRELEILDFLLSVTGLVICGDSTCVCMATDRFVIFAWPVTLVLTRLLREDPPIWRFFLFCANN